MGRELTAIKDILKTRPWAQWDNKKLIHNNVLGYVTPEQERAVAESGAIIRQDNVWRVASEVINAAKDGARYKAGDKIVVVSHKYNSWRINQLKKEVAYQYQKEADETINDQL